MSSKGSLNNGAGPQHSDDVQAKPDVGSAVEDWLDCLWSEDRHATQNAERRQSWSVAELMPLFNAVDVVAQPVTRPEADGLAWPGEAREANGSQLNAPGAASAMDQDERPSSRKRSAVAMMGQSAAAQHTASVHTAKTLKSPMTVSLYSKCTRAHF